MNLSLKLNVQNIHDGRPEGPYCPGCDRNFSACRAARNAIDFIHENPVRRGLVERASDWKRPSAHGQETAGEQIAPDLPTFADRYIRSSCHGSSGVRQAGSH